MVNILIILICIMIMRFYDCCLLDRDGKSDSICLVCIGSLNLVLDIINYKGNNLW